MISSQQGVESIKVSLADKEATVRYNPEKISAENITVQIYDMGFDAYLKSVNGKPVKNGKKLFISSKELHLLTLV